MIRPEDIVYYFDYHGWPSNEIRYKLHIFILQAILDIDEPEIIHKDSIKAVIKLWERIVAGDMPEKSEVNELSLLTMRQENEDTPMAVVNGAGFADASVLDMQTLHEYRYEPIKPELFEIDDKWHPQWFSRVSGVAGICGIFGTEKGSKMLGEWLVKAGLKLSDIFAYSNQSFAMSHNDIIRDIFPKEYFYNKYINRIYKVAYNR